MFFKIFALFWLYQQTVFISGSSSIGIYDCNQGYCVKSAINSNTSANLSFAECNIQCLDSAGIWPKPTGNVSVKNLTEINLENFYINIPQDTAITSLLTKAYDIFIAQVRKLTTCRFVLQNKKSNLNLVYLSVNISDQEVTNLTFGTNESYRLLIFQNAENIINVTIESETFFGARYALETLSQLIVYDEVRSRLLLPNEVTITDGPVFSWRGVALDTSRNYITPKVIKKTLTAMAASKLNTFHWHITDTASFPYVSKTRPEFSELGSYTPQKVYNDATIRDIIEYARVRGIRVVPEFDAPAHVGEGWQDTEVLTCFNWHPWQNYCVEPPCGQFDPSRAKLYDLLEDLYGDMLDQFGTEVFHMGGDEVNINCWNNTENLTNWMVNEMGWDLTSTNFYSKVWAYFQNEASKRLYKKAGKEIPIILWSSELTSFENVTDILSPDKYLIQVWTSADDGSIQTLLEKNYSIILSNYDALYLDCGFSGWVTNGNNWCSPYKGWQLIYENKPENIAGNKTNQVLGGETALWTEQAGSGSTDSRLWPRAAAFAETLWTNPLSNWTEAEERMLLHTERLSTLGINVDKLQPEWCLRNQQNCPLSGKLNN